MKRILAEISVGELLDKLTILEIKLEKIRDKDSLKIIECDLSREDEILKVIEENKSHFESIYEIWHLAANSDIPSGVTNPKIDFRDTFMTTFNLLEIARKYSIKNFF